MVNSRIKGNNIALELEKSSMSLEEFAHSMGFDEKDVYKLLEGRLFVSKAQLTKIAKLLGVGTQELSKEREASAYNSIIYNNDKFVHKENQEFVLDIIDAHADLEQALEVHIKK